MKSNYKKLGEFIRPIKTKNKDLKVKQLIGLSNEKYFMPSIANTIGTNMANYRVIKKNQFAYCPITSRNGDKITVGLQQKYDIAIVSQAYPVFDIIDKNELLPEYLMMWFKRPEFDRYARFKSHGSARESFGWEELCDVELPVPSIEKQKAIVKEYNTIVNRIQLNEQLNQQLEATAQALYKHWFVDFEFPNENDLPYKSSGGEMVYNEELEKDVPLGWEVGTIEDLGNVVGGATPSKAVKEYWTDNGIAWITPRDLSKDKFKFVSKGEFQITELGFKKSSTRLMPKNSVLFSSRAPIGYMAISLTELCTNQGFKSVVPFDDIQTAYVYYFLKNETKKIADESTGSTFSEVSTTTMKNYTSLIPNNKLSIDFNILCQNIFDYQRKIEGGIMLSRKFIKLILGKMSISK